MSYLLASAARATVGARSGQEDAFNVWPAEGQLKPSGDSGMLAVLADGMGGHRGGAVAGQTACATFTQAFSAAQMPLDQRLDMALHASNDAIADAVDKNSGLKGMGCTLIGAWLDDTGMRWTSVGDSLLLLYRFPDVIRLNEDHSLGSYLDEQARRNEISYEEARDNRHRNALRSALTGSKIDLVDLRGEPLELIAGDWILLASDGIASLEGDELADIMYRQREGTPEEMAQALISAVEVKAVPEQDNTTVVAIRVEGASETAMMRPSSNSKAEQVTLRTRRIGVVSGRKMVTNARKPVAPPPPRSTFETLMVKGPVALLLAAGAAFVLAAAIYLYKASRGLDPFAPQPAVDAPATRPDINKQRQPAQPDAPRERRVEPPGPPSAQPPLVVPVPVPAVPPSSPQAPQAQPPPVTNPTPFAPVRPAPGPQPKAAPPPSDSPGALRGTPNSRRTAPAPSTSDDPDSTSEPTSPNESTPGGSESSGPQPQQGSSPATRGPPRRSDKGLSAPLPAKDDVAKQPTARRDRRPAQE
jgi:PPM family protein phosphatase